MTNPVFLMSGNYPDWLLFLFIPIGLFALFILLPDDVQYLLIKGRRRSAKKPPKKK
jgi:hypothetical protein